MISYWYNHQNKKLEKLPDLDLLHIFIRYGVQHGIVLQVKHLVYAGKHHHKTMLVNLPTSSRSQINRKNTYISEAFKSLPILCRISENLAIYIIELHKARPLQRLGFKERETCIWLSSSYISDMKYTADITKRKYEQEKSYWHGRIKISYSILVVLHFNELKLSEA